ncbi:DUF2235 domain-containing protein [Hydrogenimonas cancrithermarum]|uniref:T6SS Phospholipase effector Tle1-like catalytic domain-containing protein n=1 Tax=Hydrogenimonas cancrithermarum TaxID=2993563 RepID=A0ABN6WTS8_9BACT|nr:DUF2235 domain-containing protein [Hydrogenimonas cancrithermarum]BDY12179.1 hypothetical protein HCR_04910 [Hydrogenimonas cancrithermarum]
MRNLVVCADGTWNTPEQKEHDIPVPTNVVRIFNSIAKSDKNGIEQLRYYHPGVGTDGTWWEKMAGGAVGVGLGKNIKSAYKWLCVHYEPGDRIFLFGFSRGAYTVRSLAGMIAACGLLDLTDLPDETLWERVQKAYEEGYRKRKKRSEWSSGWNFHKNEKEKKAIPIHFLGVWDTVGALGIPNNMAILNLLDSVKKYNFHDTKLGAHVLHGRHAVAIDEQRASFSPTCWNNISEHNDAKELWFPGVHANVGGGYVDTGLSDIALQWMIEEAREAGINFKKEMVKQIKPDIHGILYDSQTGIFKHMRSMPRSMPPIVPKSLKKSLHPSAIARQSNPPIDQTGYHETRFLKKGESIEIPVYALDPWNETGIYLEAKITYKFEASGQWMDRNIKCGPEGADDGHFYIEEIFHMAGTLWGKIEELYKKVTKNEAADFIGSRREEKIPWFALVGSIANGGNPKKDGTLGRHETFKIGKKCKHTPKKGGYLFTYANDAWNFYGNNRGSVRLKITCLG